MGRAVFVLSFACSTFSEYDFKFKNYSVKDGLPHDKVNKVVQDSKGFCGWLQRVD